MMYHGKHEAPQRAARHSFKKAGVLLAALVLIVSGVVGGTLAYLATSTTPVVNTFTPAEIKIEIEENFDEQVKTDVGIKNTGDADAYVRMKLVETWVKVDGTTRTPVAKPENASVNYDPATPGTDWFEMDGTWYYSKKLAAQQTAALYSKITYTAPEGYALDLHVMGEGIQAVPAEAVENAWGVVVNAGNIAARLG